MWKRILKFASLTGVLVLGIVIGVGAPHGGFIKDVLGKLAFETVSATGDTVINYPDDLIVNGSSISPLFRAGTTDVSVGSDLAFLNFGTGLLYGYCAEDMYDAGLESSYKGIHYQGGSTVWATHNVGWATAFGSETGTEAMMSSNTLDGFYFVMADTGFFSLGDYDYNDGNGHAGSLSGVTLSSVEKSTPLLQSHLRATLTLKDTDDRGEICLGTEMGTEHPESGASLQIDTSGNVVITLPVSNTSEYETMVSGQQRSTTRMGATTAQGLAGLDVKRAGTFNPQDQ